MAAAGNVEAKILVQIGDSEPIKIGTVEILVRVSVDTSGER